jgi:hypothetical protein
MTRKRREFLGPFPRRAGRFLAALIVTAPALFFLRSCGIESYYYLPEVPAGNIATTANQWATVTLPSVSVPYFTYFALYYRIYLSYEQIANTGNLAVVNTTLDSDYRYLAPYTNSASSTSINVSSIMTSRGYQSLYFQTSSGGASSDLLTMTSGGTVRIEFPLAGANPYITYPVSAGTRTVILLRSNGNGAFNPLPNRYFLSSDTLTNPGNISATANADVVNVSGSGGNRYAYASLYIVSVGLNEQTYTPIFSIPTFVGIFRLP